MCGMGWGDSISATGILTKTIEEFLLTVGDLFG